MIKKVSPKCLWDCCIEMEALICSHTAHSVYEFDGVITETKMTRHTANMSNICEYEWYQWVMFHYQPITYPYLTIVMGWYLGKATEVISTMTYNKSKLNG